MVDFSVYQIKSVTCSVRLGYCWKVDHSFLQKLAFPYHTIRRLTKYVAIHASESIVSLALIRPILRWNTLSQEDRNLERAFGLGRILLLHSSILSTAPDRSAVSDMERKEPPAPLRARLLRRNFIRAIDTLDSNCDFNSDTKARLRI